MSERSRDDLAARPIPFLFGWGAPIIALIALNLARAVLPYEAIVWIMAAALAWMGTACVLNARRCRRRHCAYSGPVLLAAAILTPLVGFDLIALGPRGLDYVLWSALALVILSFVAEWIWGRYIPRKGETR
jgi:hypothetical protein